MPRVVAALAAAMLALAPAMAWAHLMPAHQATLTVRERQAFLALSLPATSFAAADADHDGRLSPDEVARHQELLQRLVATRVHLRDGDRDGRLAYASVAVERQDPDSALAPARDVLVLVVADFDVAPATVTLRVDGLARGEEGRLQVRATQAGRTEIARLDGDNSSHAFFASPWHHFGDGVRMGAEHIASGADHLAFLLVLVLVGAGLAYWGAVISSFTAAHALVLVLAAMGHAPSVPPALTEVLIAATIVATAARVVAHGRARHPRVGREALLAGLCGLVHGMGVSAAMRALDANGRPDLVALAGFNVGVEGAQLVAVLLFVGALALVTAAVARSRGVPRLLAPDGLALPSAWTPRVIAGAVGAVGTAWMVMRIPALW